VGSARGFSIGMAVPYRRLGAVGVARESRSRLTPIGRIGRPGTKKVDMETACAAERRLGGEEESAFDLWK